MKFMGSIIKAKYPCVMCQVICLKAAVWQVLKRAATWLAVTAVRKLS